MTDGITLRRIIKANGIKLGFICKKLNISRATFRGRLNNNTEFTAKEIMTISDILNLTSQSRDSIFFADVSELKSQHKE